MFGVRANKGFLYIFIQTKIKDMSDDTDGALNPCMMKLVMVRAQEICLWPAIRAFQSTP